MSRKLKRILYSALFVLVFGAAGILIHAQIHAKGSDAEDAQGLPDYFVDKYGKIIVPEEPDTEDARDTRGTEGNPYFILEIVPYDGMAEFGYQIAGCEPIDVDAAARDGVYIPGQSTYYTTKSDEVFRFWPEELPETFPGTQTDTMNQYGTMTYVEDGSGQFNLSAPLEEGADATKAEYVAVEEDEEGDFLWVPLSAEQCYSMTDDEKEAYEGEFTEEVVPGTSFAMFFEDVEFIYGTGSKVTHKNTFLRESVGLAYEFDSNGIRKKITDETVIAEKIKNYKSVVYTVTPEDLNMNPDLVERADLIVISSKAKSLPTSEGCPNGIYTEKQAGDADIYGDDDKVLPKYTYIPYLKKHLFGYEEKNPTQKYVRKENKPGATFKTNLIDWSIVLKIYERATDQEHVCPIVTDQGVYQNTYNDTSSGLVKNVKLKMQFGDNSVKDGSTKPATQDNMTKLFLMLYQMETPVFELLYGDPNDSGNALFSSQDMKKTNGQRIQKKDGTYLQTGVFNYDNGRAHDKQGNEDSRAYWNDLTLLPWHLMPNSTGYNNVGTYGPIMATYGITVENGGYNMTSGDAQNSIRNGLMVYFGDEKLTTKLLDDSGVKNNIFGAQVYEYFDAVNGPEQGPPASVTVAECLAYLIGGVNGGPTPAYNTRQYKILELQPSSVFETESNPLFWKLIIAAYTNSVAEPVVDTMSTSEFIGSHVDCISEYDLIYVGMKKSTTDPTMQFNGGINYVYAHTGPEITLSSTYSALYGWLRSEKIHGLSTHESNEREKKFAYSGNDLTEAAYKKLFDYNKAGFPILFGDGFFSNYSGSYTVANTIDRNSNIYKLGDIIDDAGTSAVYKTQLGNSAAVTEKFRQMLSVDNKKVEMMFFTKPVIYNSENAVEDRYINGHNNSYRTLYYGFKVNAPAGTSYQVRLFVDVNNDGTFTPGQEDVGAEVFKVNANGTQGGSVTSGVVEAGKSYYVKRQLGSHVGAVNWKLELVKNGKIYASENGVSAIQARTDGSEDVHIRVLQILPKNAYASLKLPMSQQDANQIGGASKKFYEKIEQLNGLDIQFYRMTQAEVLNQINGAGGSNYLYDNYDMLVLGFADIYDGVSDISLLNKIKDFIARGKAVLYTHDTSSGIGKNGTGTFQVWGRTITEACRDLFGMDRYGACTYYDTGNLNDIPDTKDVPYKPSNDSDIVTKYVNKVGTPLIQGLSNGILYRTAKGNNINSYEVTKVNEGAITQYPFTIEDKIDVAQTHPQYYQLDMEQEDIVVWYCLDGGTQGKSQSYESTYYGTSKNDVRNNYYIYNKGNVTYSGMGHVNGNNAVNLPDAEIELFINTFVAAYRASAEGVKVEVVNNDASGTNSGDQYLCVDVDSSDADEVIGNDIEDSYTLQVTSGDGYAEAGEFAGKSKRVYFRLVDNNSFGNTTYEVQAIPNNGPAEDKTLAVYERASGTFVDNVNLKFEGNTVYYYVDVPINIEANTDENGVTTDAVGTTEVKISVKMTYMVGSESIPVDADTNVYIVPRGLYDLD